MNLGNIFRTLEKFAVDNSPLILTSVAVAGTIGTALLSGHAAYEAREILDEVEPSMWRDANTPPTKLEKIKVVWPLFIPPAGTLALTLTAIIMANRIGTRRAAAMAAAYTLSERAFEEYRDKVVEKLGPNKERAARDELAQDRMDRNPISQNNVVLTGNGTVPCYDAYSGRYFESDMESIKKAMNDTNYRVINHDGASVNEFYDKLGLGHIEVGEEMGWNSDELLDIYFSTTMTDDQKPAISIEFRTKPIRSYFRLH